MKPATVFSIKNGTQRIPSTKTTSCTLRCKEGARATVILIQPENKRMDVSLHAEAHAEIDVITIIEGEHAPEEIVQRGTVEEDAKIHWWNVTLPSSDCTWNLATDVTGTNAESTVHWLFHAKGYEHYRLSVRNDFHARNGRGKITVHGIAEDHAHASAHGMIMIEPDGSGTDAYLTEKILMLDTTAKVDAVPALEIKANDVKAGHCASVTKLNEEDLFYMGSRGINLPTARKMCIEGFLGSLLETMENAETRQQILTAIEEKIGR